MMRSHLCAAATLLAALAWGTPAHAHLMPRQQGTVNVRDSAVFCVFSIPVSALTGWDQNADGRMHATELDRARATIMRQITAGITLESGGDTGQRDFVQASLDLEEGDSSAFKGATHLIVLLRQSFVTVPRDVRLAMTLFGAAPDEKAFLIKGTQGGAPEVGILDASRPARLFFRPFSLPSGPVGWIGRTGSLLSGPPLLGVIGVAAILLVLSVRRRGARHAYAIHGPAVR